MEHSTVFICYDPADAVSTRRYAEALHVRGFDIWYEKAVLLENNPLSPSVTRELEARSAFLLLMSPSAINSISVDLQLEAYRNALAQGSSRRFLAVQIAPCKIPALLPEHYLIDAVHLTFEDAVAAISDVLRGLKPSSHSLPSHLSRRAVIVAIIGLIGLAIVGERAFAWWQESRPAPAINNKQPALGTTLFTFRGHVEGVHTVAWSPDGKYIASGGDDLEMRVWDAATGSLSGIYIHENHIYSVSWSSDSKYLASSGESSQAQVWNTITKELLSTYTHHTDWILKVRWSPKEKRIVSASKDRTVQIWDAFNGDQILTYRGHSNIVFGVAWSPDGTRIASASGDGTVRVWNATNSNLRFIYRGHTDGVANVAWSFDGSRIASVSKDKSVQVWDATSGKRIQTFLGHSDIVYGVAWSPDDTRIASGSFDNTVRVWDTTTGKHIFTYRGHSASVYEVAWSADGTWIASCSDDKTVQVWQAR